MTNGLREICRMTSLERLEIVHCHWTDSGAVNLANLKNLQRLQLGSRTASGAAIANLRGLPKLRELDLHESQQSQRGDCPCFRDSDVARASRLCRTGEGR